MLGTVAQELSLNFVGFRRIVFFLSFPCIIPCRLRSRSGGGERGQREWGQPLVVVDFVDGLRRPRRCLGEGARG